MTPSQRERARARLDAILAWQAGELSLDAAREAADLSRTRFYTVAAEFRSAGTLESLGALAGAGAARQRLDPDVVNALQAVVPEVVATNGGASVSQLVRLMVEASGVDEKALPGSTRLRAIVEAEQRRVEATGQAGHALKVDVTAVNLPSSTGRPWLLYSFIDEGTRLVLGFAVRERLDDADGYRAAAADALERLAGPLAGIRWVDRLMRMEVVVGGDRDFGIGLRSRLIEGGVRANVQLAPTRYGRYWRKLVGQRVGRVEITPGRTEYGSAVADNDMAHAWSASEARGAVGLAVDQHNAAVLAELGGTSGRPVMPEDMALALRILSD